MELQLPKKLGEVLKAQIHEANAINQVALAKANANKMIMDALIEDAGLDLKEFGRYHIQEREGIFFIVQSIDGSKEKVNGINGHQPLPATL